jgi:hypothetical protein
MADSSWDTLYIAEPLVPDPIPFKVEIAIVRLKRNKRLGFDLFPLELIQAESETTRSEMH